MESILQNLAFEWKIENGESAILADLLHSMGIKDYHLLPYEGFIHSLARGIMKANDKMNWKGGYSYKQS